MAGVGWEWGIHSWRVVALEARLEVETNSQFLCIFQSLEGSESHKPMPLLGQALCQAQPPGESSMIRL